MGIIKKRRTMNDNREMGLDAETSQFVKDFLIHNLNPLSNAYVISHDRPNDPYDYKMIEEENGRRYTTYIEIKSGNAQLSPQERKFQAEHPRSYKIIRVERESEYHQLKNDARKLKGFANWLLKDPDNPKRFFWE
tara:strand:- start:117 stop:521 length:405 start_codon:yes stop_codon:yes gene_type:complete